MQKTPPPAPPPPPPTPPTPPTIDIPDDPDPAAAAIRLWGKVHPGAAAELQQRIATATEELANLVDFGRTDPGMPLREFTRRAAYRVTLRNTLESRLAAMQGGDPPRRPDIAVEVFDLVVSVRRWKDREVLKDERGGAIRRIGLDLARVEADIRHHAAAHGNSRQFMPGSPEHKAGLIESGDLWLTRMTALLTERAGLRERLVGLGDDRQARAASITAAVATANEQAVVDDVAKVLPASSDFGAANSERVIRELDGRLAGLDPETRLYSTLDADRTRLQDRLKDAQAARAGSQADAARRLVREASGGSLEHIAQLQPHVRHPALAGALATARGVDEHLVATVSELIGGTKS
jgi:hypothetical protein